MTYIARLRGEVVGRGIDWLVIDVGGVGYRVAVTAGTAAASGVGASVVLHTHLAIREDGAQLFGFETREELELFELLIGVSGVGPRSALALLSTLAVPAIRAAISSASAEPLKKVPGIGAKIAGRIILELQPKFEVSDLIATTEAEPAGTSDVVAALKGLGYTAGEINDALRATAAAGAGGTEERLREVLRYFATGQ